LVDPAVPAPPPAMLDRALDAAMTYANERGVTSVDHMGTWEDLALFERAHRAGTMRTRIYAAVPHGSASAVSRGSSTARSVHTPRR
jgi:predicted amidohydrolase YtcJ